MVEKALFTRLYTTLEPQMRQWLHAKGVAPAHAKDLIHETFLRVWLQRAALTPEIDLVTLLWMVLRYLNVLLDCARPALSITGLSARQNGATHRIPSLDAAAYKRVNIYFRELRMRAIARDDPHFPPPTADSGALR